jgi:glycosyltransferase involved in cell wall biosynthesis
MRVMEVRMGTKPNGLGVELSVVIPALNEATQLPRTLAAAQEYLHGRSYEIVVVDHGSSDGTAELAEAGGARVIRRSSGTIGSLRNVGARHARGRYLLFIDADVSLTAQWRERLPVALQRLEQSELLLTGSHCAPPELGGWIERNWFRQIALQERVGHLGTGHMLVLRESFERLGGFDETLQTGEDYEFCQRLLQEGGQIVNDASLKVVHHGYPKKLWAFIQREAWHGLGDVCSLRSVIGSKVALGALAFMIAHLLLVIGAVTGTGLQVAGVGVVVLAALLIASSQRKYKRAPLTTRLVNTVLYYFYYLGRSVSFCRMVTRPRRSG